MRLPSELLIVGYPIVEIQSKASLRLLNPPLYLSRYRLPDKPGIVPGPAPVDVHTWWRGVVRAGSKPSWSPHEMWRDL